jgi:hypothetical protein
MGILFNRNRNGGGDLEDLREALKILKIPHTYVPAGVFGKIVFPWCNSDVIATPEYNGVREDTYEIFGTDLMYPEEIAGDEVAPHLEIHDVMKRILNFYTATHEEKKEKMGTTVRALFQRRKENSKYL